MADVGHVWVPVTPSMRGFGKKVRAELRREFGQGIKVPLKPELEGDPLDKLKREAPKQGREAGGEFSDAFQKRVRAALRSLPDVEINADSSDADEKIAGIRMQLNELDGKRIGIDVDTAEAERRLDQIRDDLASIASDDARPDVDVNVAAARAALGGLERQLDDIDGRTVRVNADTSSLQSSFFLARNHMFNLTAAVVALGPAALPVFGAVAAGAMSLVGPLAAAGAGFAGLVAVAVPGVANIAEALKAQEAAQKDAATTAVSSARDQLQASFSTQQAAMRVADAQRQADRVAVDGARRVAEAREALAQTRVRVNDSIVAAQDELVASERDVERAQEDVRRAQEQLTLARRDAILALQDLREETSDLALSEEAADIALIEARQRLNRVNADSTSTALDRRKAILDVREAEDRLSDVQRDRRRTAKELNDAEREGIAGSEQVVRAQDSLRSASDRAREAREAQRQATRDLQRAESEGAKEIQRAQAQVTQAREDAAQAVADAQRQVKAATQAQIQQQRLANLEASEGSAAQRNLAYAMQELTPAQRELMRGWQGLSSEFSTWAQGLERPVFRPMIRGMQLLQGMFPHFTPIVRSAARGVDSFMSTLSDAGDDPIWGQFRDFLARMSGPTIATIGRILLNIAKGFAGIAIAFEPMSRDVLGGLERLSAGFAEWGANLKNNEGFKAFIGYIRENWPKLREMLGSVRDMIVNIVRAAAPLAGPVLAALGGIADVVARIPPGMLAAIGGAIIGVATATNIWAIAQAALNRGMKANLIILLAAAVAGLVVYLVRAYQTNEDFRRSIDNAMKAIRPVIDRVKKSFSELIKPIMELGRTIKTTAAPWLTKIRQIIIKDLVPAMGDFLVAMQPIIKFFLERLKPVIKTVMTFIMRTVRNAMNVISGVIKVVTGIITGDWEKAWEGIKQIFSAIWDQIKAILRKTWELLKHSFKTALGTLGGIWSRAWDGIKSFFSNTWDAIKDSLKTRWNNIKTFFRLALQVFQRTWNDRWTSIKNAAVNAFESAKKGIGKAWEGVKNLVKAPIRFVIETVINKGIIGTWNGILNKLGIDKWRLKRVPLPQGFAQGGVIKSGRKSKKDTTVIRARRDESVMVPEFTKLVGERGVHAINRAAERGMLHVPGFARGGTVKPVPGGHYGYPGYPGHTGVDFPVGTGTPVRSWAAGRVNTTNRWNYSYGHHVRVSHGGGMETIYAHLSSIARRVGDMVKAGTILGRSGSTGNSTGPHLHFEIRSGGGHVNPIPYLSGAAAPPSGGIISAIGDVLSGTWRKAKGIGDWVGDTVGDFASNASGIVKRFMSGAIEKYAGRYSGGGSELFGKLITGMPTSMIKGFVERAKSVAKGLLPGLGSVGTTATGSNRTIGRSMSNAMFGAGHWSALERLWTGESNWNHRAENPSSGAYGIPQSLPASKMASEGADYRTNPVTQIRWGLKYIRDRYGTPTNAYSAWLGRNPHWYKDGGVLPPGGLGYNETRKPEYVLNGFQWDSLSKLANIGQRTVENRGGEVKHEYNINMRSVDLNRRSLQHVQHVSSLLSRVGRP